MNTSALNSFWPGKTKRRSIQPCNLAKAISEPENEIAPINAPVTPSTSWVRVDGAPVAKPINSTAPMPAAEPPPMPLYNATICGMSVIATFLPETHASSVPVIAAIRINGRLCRPGNRKVASTASNMPIPAHWIPLRAVTGEAIRCRPTMNRNAASR